MSEEADVVKLAEALARRKAKPEDPLVLDPKAPLRSARTFSERRARRLIFHAGDFYEHAGSHYVKLNDADVRAEVYGFLEGAFRRVGNDPAKLIRFEPDRAKVDNVLDALRATAHLPSRLAPPCWITEGPDRGRLLACRNGLVRLSDGGLIPHSADYFNTSAGDFDYDPDAPEPAEWLKFLASQWPDDPESVEAVEEMIGYVLSGANHHHKMFLLIGPKRCGKGTIGRIMVKLLGGAGHVGQTLERLGETFGLEPLLGKTLATVPDARLSTRANVISSRLLSISGDDDLTVDRKNKTAVTVRLPARFVFMTNLLPQIRDASGTIASRFVLVNFSVSFFGHEDKSLEAKLTRELPGILNRAIVAWRRLEERGAFVQPKSGEKNLDNLAYLASPIMEFVADGYVLDPAGETRTGELYNEWRNWHAETGQGGEPGNSNSFGIKLAAAFPGIEKQERRKMTKGKLERWDVYVGIKHRDDAKAADYAEDAAMF